MTADAFYTDQPEPRDREAEHHAAVDARDERLVQWRVQRILDAAFPAPSVALLRQTADALDKILADVQHPVVAELARVLPVFEAAVAWREAELNRYGDPDTLLALRDAIDHAQGRGIGQRGGVR